MLGLSAAALASGALHGPQTLAEATPKRKGCTFSFGTYGMKTLKTERAIEVLADIGYDGVELTVWPGWDAAPDKMPPSRRTQVRDLLRRTGLKLTSLMEHISPEADDKKHAAQLERLRRVSKLAHDLSSDSPPLIQTVLGGGTWEAKKDLFCKRLTDWAKLAERAKIVLAVKPHRGGAMSRPDQAVWLIRQLGDTPHIRMVYDYSHYAFRDMPLAETIRTALPITAHIAVKDAYKQGDRVVFALPGEHKTIDYAKLLSLFYQGGYRGDICCEVSGMVWNKPGYDPVAAAKTCHKNLAPAFEKAGVPRTG